MGTPKARCSQEPRMCETLLLANPDSKTLRPVRSRASTLAPRTGTAPRIFEVPVLSSLVEQSTPKGSHVLRCGSQNDVHLLLQFLVIWLVNRMDVFVGYGVTCLGGLVSLCLAKWFVIHTNSVIGFPRIARGAPWAGSVASACPRAYGAKRFTVRIREKEGFTHPKLWRAPCFWGTHE